MSYMQQDRVPSVALPNSRIRLLRYALIMVGILLVGRLFYVQIVRHDYYQALALDEHVKKFQIPATRGTISFQDGSGGTVPVVLNEKRFLIYADPKYISRPEETAQKMIGILGGDERELTQKLSSKTSRYVVLAKKLPKDQAERIAKLDLDGIGQKEVSVRTYPQGVMAAQVLGFVNDEGLGQYGIEGYLNDELAGKSGLQKAVTDIRGIPLANNDNVLKSPVQGKDVVLTLDIGMQRIAEEKLQIGVDRTRALRGSVVIMDARNGEVKAMANYPSYNPAEYGKVGDQSLFINASTTYDWEPGSVMKPLLVGTAFNEKAASPTTTYFDNGYVKVEDRTITNAINYGAQTTTVANVLERSLNTGAVQVLKFLGGGEINEKARTTWYTYLTEHFRFGAVTGIEQAGESSGYVGGPDEGFGLTVRYANMAFGQGLTVTPIQLAAAYAAAVNGGTYYAPHLVKEKDAQPKVVRNEVLTEQASAALRGVLQSTLQINNKPAIRTGYNLGAKSGTAQVAGPNGTYKSDAYNGAYAGYIGGDMPNYVMVVRLDEPKTPGFASFEASKTWAEISNKVLDSTLIAPITR